MWPVVLIAVLIMTSWIVMFATAPTRRRSEFGRAHIDASAALNFVLGFGFLLAGYRKQAVIAMLAQLLALVLGASLGLIILILLLFWCAPDSCDESQLVLITGMIAPVILPVLGVAWASVVHVRKLLR